MRWVLMQFADNDEDNIFERMDDVTEVVISADGLSEV